jgi:NADH dehydrogenase FAD-containing subunit
MPTKREIAALVLDRVNYTTFWPRMPSAISGNIEVRPAAHSIRWVLAPSGAGLPQAEVASVDCEAREVRTDEPNVQSRG